MKKLILHNDNNKLHCASFLHVCLYEGTNTWSLNQGYEIWWRHTYQGEAKIVEKRASTVGQLTESLASITTGFSLQCLKAELCAKGERTFPVTDNSKVHIITFRYLKYAAAHPLSSPEEKAKRKHGQQISFINQH
jgi:hypothetical protein